MSFQEAIIACELGPNCAPITELVWAMRTQRSIRVTKLLLLTNRRGEQYLDELKHALEMLHQVYGEAPELSLSHALDEEGHRVEEDITPGDAQAWMRARWLNFQQAIEEAGTDPVIFAIASNRPRSVMTSAMFTLLARPQDLCVDVRVSEPRVEGAKAGFFFPDQPEDCADEAGPIDPSSVQVHLVDLRLPRLRHLLKAEDLASYEAALAATELVVATSKQPLLRIEMKKLRVFINDKPVALTESQALWVAGLALARQSGDGWIGGQDRSHALKALEQCQQARGQPHWTPRSGVFLPKPPDVAGSLRKLRSLTRRRIKEFCGKEAVLGRHLVIPQVRRQVQGGGAVTTQQRIEIDPERIVFAP